MSKIPFFSSISVQYQAFNPADHVKSSIYAIRCRSFIRLCCTINRVAAFVDGVSTGSGQHVDLGTLVGRKRAFKIEERIPLSGGMVGMVMCRDDDMPPRRRST